MRKHIAPLVVFLVLVVSVAVGSVMASEEVMIKFPRSIIGMSRHGNLLVVVNYQKDDKNRWIELAWDSENEFGSSAAEITAETNGVPFTKDLVLSGGEYIFVATLYRSDGSTKVDRQQIFVTQ